MTNYECECCHEVFRRITPEAEAMAESKEIFGNVPKDELALVCDDCFKKLMKFAAQALRKRGYMPIDEEYG